MDTYAGQPRLETNLIPTLDRAKRSACPGHRRIAMRCFTSSLTTAFDIATRWTRAIFMRAAGTVHWRASRLNSSQRAPIASPVRAAVRIVNSRARADIAGFCRNRAMKLGTSSNGRAFWWPRDSRWRRGSSC